MSILPRPNKEELLNISTKMKELDKLILEVNTIIRKHVPKNHKISKNLNAINARNSILTSDMEEYFWSELEAYAVNPLKGFYTDIDLKLKEGVVKHAKNA